MSGLQRIILALIARYQRRGGGLQQFRVDCNFEPSCSEYARQAVTRYGAGRGLWLSLQRIRRCCEPDQVCKLHDPLPDR